MQHNAERGDLSYKLISLCIAVYYFVFCEF